ncbi:MAG: ectonucleotide pyrophosphatase/phosphodiesterase, partial [Gammaproteobacteria bacterium]|nr:ectonucleotide pyrophosphatase/phosphodiesterase [Gammaproteobacteria bacterium]
MTFILRVLCVLALMVTLAGCQTLRQTEAPHLILISIDGLGAGQHQAATTPALDRLIAEGVSADRMRPVFPSMTFPNHYSIATGLYPFEHGIVDNTFPNAARTDWYAISKREAVGDGRWYGGEPIWVSAERNNVTSAAYFFVGTEADIGGIRPTHWRNFDSSIPGAARVQQALDWLALPKRPRLVTLYFEDVDNAGHEHGPGTAPWRQAIERVDGYLMQLLDGIEQLPIADNTTIVVVSDHGQAKLRQDATPFVIDQHVSLDGLDAVEHTSYVQLFMPQYDADQADHITR